MMAVPADGDFQSLEYMQNASEPIKFAVTGPGSTSFLSVIIATSVMEDRDGVRHRVQRQPRVARRGAPRRRLRRPVPVSLAIDPEPGRGRRQDPDHRLRPRTPAVRARYVDRGRRRVPGPPRLGQPPAAHRRPARHPGRAGEHPRGRTPRYRGPTARLIRGWLRRVSHSDRLQDTGSFGNERWGIYSCSMLVRP